MNKRKSWAFRLSVEARYSLASYFITLTYDELHCDGNVHKEDIQKFFKRYRKIYKGDFKYFLCAEYGERTYRPHYHLHLFFKDAVQIGDVYDDVSKAWKLDGKKIGNVDIGITESGSIWYTTKNHITKNDVPDGLNPCFNLMSKRPAIGSDYVEKMKLWHKSDYNRVYATTDDGYKMALPRYYKDKLYNKLILQLHNAKMAKNITELVPMEDWLRANKRATTKDYFIYLSSVYENYNRLLKKESKQNRKL